MNEAELEHLMARDSLLKGVNTEFDVTRDIGLKTLLERDPNLRVELQKEVFEENRFVTSKMGNIIMNKYNMKTQDGEIYYYKDGVYIPKGADKIAEICALILDEKYKKHFSNETVSYIQGLTRVDVLENSDINLLCLENGIFDIENNTLRPHNPDIVFLNKLPIVYNENADCPNFKKFLEQIVETDDIVNIQEFFGYCLWRDHQFHTAFLLYGSGSNGKSTLISSLKSMLGSNNVASIPIQRLCQDKFATANLYGRLANLYSDLSKNAIYDTGMFKLVTGGDLITAERKFGHPFNFVNYSKQIFSCNEIPESRDDSDAFYRRWQIIMFSNTFQNEEKDVNMLSKITTPEELSGMFNWAVEGLKRLLENGKFTNEKCAEIMRDLYVMKSNSVRAFVEKCCEQDFENLIPKVDLYLAYKDFCKEQGLVPVQDNTFGKKLLAIPDFNVIQTRSEIAEKRVYCWKGIRVSN